MLNAIRPGDWLTMLAGGAVTVWLMSVCWNGGAADRAIVRSGGKVFRELPLSPDSQLHVPGPLGISVITIHDRQARIESDPSPRQYCVRQGWLKQAGEIAICLPNEISVELAGRTKNYDSLNY
ncbi:NusG domain II-containing protein [Ferriphaselus sp. R-1]|jgi:hypothetical protein|uniref:NusG domain II-containing protein n=1 Tax=Ferriphaselus sp. R-1 TaxID=1485544 RepID=UPI000554F442|nr:NusG domain II-containing protein [Ferriphaselus sp. R-1]